MTQEERLTALYEKMAAEQDTYRNWLLQQSPEEILKHTFEYTVREDIVMSMEELALTEEQAAALLDSPDPLGEVYRHFDRMETGYMDTIRDSIEGCAGELAQKQAALMEQAKALIDDFCLEEYGSPAKYGNMEQIGIAYTTITDDEIPIQVNVDLVNFRMERYLEEQLIDRVQYDSLQDLITNELEFLDFDSLIYVSDEVLESVRLSQEGPELAEQNIPVYSHSASYAHEHGEAALYRASMEANMACTQAIEEAISQHYGDNRLNSAAAVEQVVGRFGMERTLYVLANTVQQKDFDGRISRENKAWAKTIPICMEQGGSAAHDRNYFVVDKCNPGLTDLFLKQARKLAKEREQEKPSIREKLSKAPAATKRTLPAKKKEMELS